MLSKSKRLNLKKNFKWVAAGSSISDSLIKIFYRYGQNEAPLVGIALSKSSFKKAVERNRARRLVSTAIETFYQNLPMSINLVFMPRTAVLEKGSQELAIYLEKLMEKNNLSNKGKQESRE